VSDRCHLCGRFVGPDAIEALGEIYCVPCGSAVVAELPTVTRADCKDLPRPCPHTACRYHMTNEAPAGVGHPNSRTHKADVCVADLLDAEPHPHTLDEIGELFGVTRERIRQIQAKALRKLKRACIQEGIDPDAFIRALPTWYMVSGSHSEHQKRRHEWNQKNQRGS